MMMQGSLWRTLALALVAGSIAGAAPLPAAAEQTPEHCLYLQQKIARIQGDIKALEALINEQNVFMQFKPQPGQTLEEAANTAHQYYFTLGTWHDAETGTLYVIVSRDFLKDYAESSGGGDAAVQKVLARNEGLRQKVQYGGVVESLTASLAKWQDDYRFECGGSSVSPTPPTTDCLLGVCAPPQKR